MKIPMPLGSPLWIAAGWTMFHLAGGSPSASAMNSAAPY